MQCVPQELGRQARSVAEQVEQALVEERRHGQGL
jgi:hypothetical protein